MQGYDVDPETMKKAMEIHQSNMTLQEITDAIWDLFQERKKKIAEERKKKVTFAKTDERGEEELLRTESRKVSGPGEGVSGQE